VVTEADTCRRFVVPRLQTAGWDGAPHAINEQRTFTDGRVMFIGGKAKRGRQKRADYILRYSADYPIAVVEAKAAYKSAAAGERTRSPRHQASARGMDRSPPTADAA
jgi:type I restriction enzyme R subunit